MPFANFTGQQVAPFFVGAISIIFSIIAFHSGKKKLSLMLLFSGTLILGFFICSLDHFLIIWDEQFHALVAKNILQDPLKPTLYATPVLDYDFKNWTSNHVWLHKQPLFLWQMALSLKLFGINELSVRIPGILLHALISIPIYRIGKIAVNANVGFYGALFFCVASYPLELIAGRHATDHNDMAFLFYVTASFWAWFEYQNSGKGYWLIAIGLFTGCAVLVKWLVGLMLYGIWTVTMVVEDKKNWLRIKTWLPIIISFTISFCVFIPWQLYIFYKFPIEANHEFHFNTMHFFHALEDHAGDIWFHFKAIAEIYGTSFLMPVALIAGLFALLKKSGKRMYGLAVVLPIIFTYIFFTIAATKMASFCLVVSPFIFLGMGALADSILDFIKLKIKSGIAEKFLRITMLTTICIYLIDIGKIENFHSEATPKDHYPREYELAQMNFIKKLQDIVGNDQYVVFNAAIKEKGSIPVMFYTNCITYDFIPNETQINKVKTKSYKMAILVKDSLPDFIINDNDILKIKL